MNDIISCLECDKTPDELSEYSYANTQSGLEPTEYVLREEGTYNHKIKKFWCTSCYCKLGIPLGVAKPIKNK